MRTAEVTICIIHKGLLDRPQQVPHAGDQIVEDNVHGVIAQGNECSGCGRPLQQSHGVHSRNQCHLPSRGNHSFRAEDFGQLDSMKPVPPGHLSRRPGFLSPGAPVFGRHCKPVRSTMGKLPTSMFENIAGQRHDISIISND